MSSPTSRTLDLLRKEGWTAQVVEKWNPHSKTRLDLFGGIDVFACMPKAWAECVEIDEAHRVVTFGPPKEPGGFLGVQACAGASHSSRKAKLLSEKRMAIWLAAGGRLEIWSWSKRGARGKRKTWTARREPLSLSDFVPRERSECG